MSEHVVIRHRLKGEIFPSANKHWGKRKLISVAIEAEHALVEVHSRYLDLLERLDRAGLSRTHTHEPNDWITPDELVACFGGSLSTWARYRSEGNGPKWTNGGPAGILYKWADVQKWLAEGGTRGLKGRHKIA